MEDESEWCHCTTENIPALWADEGVRAQLVDVFPGNCLTELYANIRFGTKRLTLPLSQITFKYVVYILLEPVLCPMICVLTALTLYCRITVKL